MRRLLLVGVIVCNVVFVVAMLVRDDARRRIGAPASYVLVATSVTAVFVAARDHRRQRAMGRKE